MSRKSLVVLSLWIVLVTFFAPAVWAAETVGVKFSGNQEPHTPNMTLMSNYSTAGFSTTYNLQQVAATHIWEIDVTGSPSSVELILQGSIDCSNFYDLDTYTGTSDIMRFVYNKPVKCIRSRLVTFDSGSVTIRSIHRGN